MKRKFGQQFHKYQQSKQLPLITYWALYKNMIYDIGQAGSSLGQTQTGGQYKPVNVIPILPYDWFNRIYQSDIDTKYYMQIQCMQFWYANCTK